MLARNLSGLAKAVVLALGLTFLGTLPSAALTAPTNVVTASSSETNSPIPSASAQVTWQSVSGAVAYSVRASAGGTNIPGSTPACQANECVSFLTDLTGGTDYSVVVTAVNQDGGFSESNPVSHRAISVPSAPAVRAPSVSSGTVTLGWVEPNNLGGLTILDYRIFDSSNNNLLATISANSTSHTITGLTNGNSYQYSIRARNSNGLSATASFQVATPVGVPATPGRPSVTTGSNSVTATWSAPANGGSPITGYTLRLFQGGLLIEQETALAAATSFTFNGLADGSYTVRILATNAQGNSELSPASRGVAVGNVLIQQEIVFSNISNQPLPGPLQLNVTADSGLAVTLVASGLCSVNSFQLVTFLGVGVCQIVATQAGNSTFEPAEPVTRSFNITAAQVGTTPIVGGGGGGGSFIDIRSYTTRSALVSGSAFVEIRGASLTVILGMQLAGIQGVFITRSPALVIARFDGVSPGTYSLAIDVSFGKLTLSSNVVVFEGPVSSSTSSPSTTSSATASPESSGQKITIGTFKGFVAVYFKGYQGTRVSIKIAGRWIVVPRVPKDFHRVVRNTGAGFTVKSEVYINRKLVQERLLVTR